MARTFVVHESKRRRKNSLMYRPNNIISKKDLAEPLRRLIDLKGEFDIPNAVRDVYDSWYMNLDDDSDDPTGTMERIGDSVLKVAMLISLSKSNDLIITTETLSEAIRECESTLPGIKRVSIGGKTEISEFIQRAMSFLIDAENNEIERPKLLSKLSCEAIVLDRVLDTLEQAEVIYPRSRRTDKNEVPNGPEFYKMKEEVFQKYMEMKNQT